MGMKQRLRRLLAALLVGGVLVLPACSASGKVDTGGDGVKIEGDVDQQK
jgi:hypothetical protein